MQLLTEWMAEGTSPILITLLMGLLFSLEPHALMTNIAAFAYIGQDAINRKLVFRNALFYIVGRTISYGLIGFVFWFMMRQGILIDSIAHIISHYGLYIIVPFMFIMGFFLIFHIHLPHIHFKIDKYNQKYVRQPLGSFALGALLSLAFCPANALLFFGFVIPMTVNSSSGILLLILFALITAVPVVIIAWIIAFSVSKMPTIYSKFQRYNKVVRRLVGVLFVLIALALMFTPHSHHSHEHPTPIQINKTD